MKVVQQAGLQPGCGLGLLPLALLPVRLVLQNVPMVLPLVVRNVIRTGVMVLFLVVASIYMVELLLVMNVRMFGNVGFPLQFSGARVVLQNVLLPLKLPIPMAMRPTTLRFPAVHRYGSRRFLCLHCRM